MKTAKELLLAYLENIGNPHIQTELFTDVATLELPYLAPLGLLSRWKGREGLHNFLSNLPKKSPGFKYRNIQIHVDTPKEAFGEYEAAATIGANGKACKQNYMARVVAEKGKIKLLREALYMVPVLRDIRGNIVN